MGHDLDDEELKATRRLNRVAKDNIEDIEIEDIETIRSFLLKTESGIELRLVEKENYDKLVKRIKELEEENKELNSILGGQ